MDEWMDGWIDRWMVEIVRTYVRFFVESGLEVIDLLLKQGSGLGQFSIGPVQFLDLVMEGVVLLAQSRLHPVQLLVLAGQLLHLGLQTTDQVILTTELRLSRHLVSRK